MQPDGSQFAKPLQVSIRYYPDALGKGETEADLTVLHDGVNLPTNVNTTTKKASAGIAHFTGVTVTPYKYAACSGVSNPNGVKCSVLKDINGANVNINYHLAIIDRIKLKDNYQLRVLASPDGKGKFTSQIVETLAKKTEP